VRSLVPLDTRPPRVGRQDRAASSPSRRTRGCAAGARRSCRSSPKRRSGISTGPASVSPPLTSRSRDTHRHAWKSFFRNLNGRRWASRTSARITSRRRLRRGVSRVRTGPSRRGSPPSSTGPTSRSTPRTPTRCSRLTPTAGIRTVFVHAAAPGRTRHVRRRWRACQTVTVSPLTTFAVGPGDPDPPDLDGSTADGAAREPRLEDPRALRATTVRRREPSADSVRGGSATMSRSSTAHDWTTPTSTRSPGRGQRW
jgi:hypothetical protein